jgi:hypothetical protein
VGTAYTRTLKPGHANDFTDIVSLGNKVRSILSGIVHDGNDLEAYVDEVQIQMQPRPDGSLAIIGWIAREPVEGIPDEQYDDEIEIVPQLPTPEEILQQEQEQIFNTTSPFQR